MLPMDLNIIAERLSAKQLILLRISFCVGIYVCMYVCPSRLGMLISVHCARALLFPACLHASKGACAKDEAALLS